MQVLALAMPGLRLVRARSISFCILTCAKRTALERFGNACLLRLRLPGLCTGTGIA